MFFFCGDLILIVILIGMLHATFLAGQLIKFDTKIYKNPPHFL